MRNQFKQFQIMQYSYRLLVQFKAIHKIRDQSTDHLQSTLVSIFPEYLTLRIREVYKTLSLTIHRKTTTEVVIEDLKTLIDAMIDIIPRIMEITQIQTVGHKTLDLLFEI